MLALALAAAVSAAFEGGALAGHEWIAPDHLVAAVPGQTDQDGRNRQPSWFYFSISGVKGRTLTVDLAGFEGEYNYRPHDGSGHRNTRPAFSYDNREWSHFEAAEWLEKPARPRVRFTPREDTVWIARIPPYPLRRLEEFLESIRGNRAVRTRELGKSVEGRPLQLLTLTEPGAEDARKKQVWIVARQHAWEAGTSWALEGLVREILAAGPEGARLRAAHVFHIIPTMDPDGLVHGGVRFNRNGYDLNRNWDVDDPAKMPEIAAVKRWMLAQRRKPDLFLTLHNTESADFLQGPLARFRALGERLNDALTRSSHFHAPGGVRDFPAEAPARGRSSVDQWVFRQFAAPAFLIELMVDTNPKLGRPPHTPDRLAFGAALARAIAAAL